MLCLELTAPEEGGPLLETAVVDEIPQLDFETSREETNANLRVISVRIDPCFPLPTPQSCQKQIRLVWQPLQKISTGEIITVDASLHSFYVLSDEEFDSLLVDLQAWKKKYKVNTSYLPLQVHPAWFSKRDRSPSFIPFTEIIKKYVGMENLSRVTAMVLRGGGRMWAFAGFEYREGKLELIPVPRLGGKLSQAFVNMSGLTDIFEGEECLRLLWVMTRSIC